jgi:HAMP domain-containing protein
MGPSDEAIPVVPADASEALPSGPLRSGEDLLAPPFFLIAADLHDGRWLTIEPSFRTQRRRLMLSLAFIFIGTLLIAAIAVLTARSLIAPLSQLATAADALGRSPEIIETPRPGIGEFAAIHKAFETMQTRLKRFVGERTHMPPRSRTISARRSLGFGFRPSLLATANCARACSPTSMRCETC